jgi:hypothetical protein
LHLARHVHNRAISKSRINFTPMSRITQYFRIAHGASLSKLQTAHRRRGTLSVAALRSNNKLQPRETTEALMQKSCVM